MRDLEKIAVKQLTCGKCKRGPGWPCLTRSGVNATRTHAARLRPLEAAWRIGWSDGGTEVLEHVGRRCSPDLADLDPRGTLERTLEQVKRWFL